MIKGKGVKAPLLITKYHTMKTYPLLNSASRHDDLRK